MYVQGVGKPQGKVQDPRLVPKLELLIKFFITSRPNGPTPVLLPGKSHGWRSLVGCSPWGR